MSGINRFNPIAKTRALSASSALQSGTCVFISHKREDSDLAVQVGNLLKNMEIDIWLDLAELDAPMPKTSGEHKALTEAIEAGIANSTHLLALISPKTQDSWWAPYEVSAARAGKKSLAFLLHKDVSSMPSYFVYGEWLIDQESLCKWAEKLSTHKSVASANRFVVLSRSNSIDRYLPKSRVFTAAR